MSGSCVNEMCSCSDWLFFHRETQCVHVSFLRARIPPWPSAWRRTTASTTWWPRQQRPWGSGWTSSSQERRDTHNSWTNGVLRAQATSWHGRDSSITHSTGPSLFPVRNGHDALFVTLTFLNSVRFYFTDVFTCTCSVRIEKGSPRRTHISVYKPKWQRDPSYIAKWRYCSYCFSIVSFSSLCFLPFFLQRKLPNDSMPMFCSTVPSRLCSV